MSVLAFSPSSRNYCPVSLGPAGDEREDIEDGCQENISKRDAEEVSLGKKDIAQQEYQAKGKKKDGLEQEIAVLHSQVAVHCTEQDEAVAMTGVEADPGLPHCCFARNNRRDLLHADL